MFQFRRSPAYAYFVQRRLTEYCSAGFPHSEILGSIPMCGSPRLIAACHVLHRLLMPRHSPCALSSLTSSAWTSYPSLPRKARKRTHFVTPPLPRESLPLPLGVWSKPCLVLSRIMQASEFSAIVVLPLLKLHKFYLLCCLLFIWNVFHCSVFKVHSPVSFETRYKHSTP